MEKIAIQLTEFQRKKILRDRQIMEEYKGTKGAKTARCAVIAKKHGITPGMVYKVIQKEGL